MDALVTVSLNGDQLVGGIVGAAALLGALAYLVRVVRRFGRTLHAVHRIVTRELDAGEAGEQQSEPVKTLVNRELAHNHGTSMKDDVHGLSVAVGALSRQVDDIDDRLTTHLDERNRQ